MAGRAGQGRPGQRADLGAFAEGACNFDHAQLLSQL